MKAVKSTNKERIQNFVSDWSAAFMITVVLITMGAVVLILTYGRSSIGRSDLSEMTLPANSPFAGTLLTANRVIA
ncbi:hypothetical protein ATDW_34920 (plasmid) [Asticcacaulis sp. DW145]|uniref:hypothetical protein n=1 Tax=unclassified Asticcacaulis TaxID=2628350 RepID=UPI003085FF1D|nr:hypothetical protein ATDW_34920 [Asticcacaulis sp. DW145]